MPSVWKHGGRRMAEYDAARHGWAYRIGTGGGRRRTVSAWNYGGTARGRMPFGEWSETRGFLKLRSGRTVRKHAVGFRPAAGMGGKFRVRIGRMW